jgi:hypothetical protein
MPNQQFFRRLHAAGMRSTARETHSARNSRPSRSEQQPREHADKLQDQQHRPNTPPPTPDDTQRCSTDRCESHGLIVIIEAARRKITGLGDFGRNLRRFNAGDTIDITALRAGIQVKLTVTLGVPG